MRINCSTICPFLNVPAEQVIHPELQTQPSHSEGAQRSHFQIVTQN